MLHEFSFGSKLFALLIVGNVRQGCRRRSEKHKIFTAAKAKRLFGNPDPKTAIIVYSGTSRTPFPTINKANSFEPKLNSWSFQGGGT